MSKKRRSLIPPGTDTILVSSCLVGEKCCYDGESRLSSAVKDVSKGREVILACPEVLAGLGVPRAASEIALNGDGDTVLDERSKVFNSKGIDITKLFICGAEETLKIAKNNNVKYAIMKSNSPSCGVGWIYDGSFSGKIKRGNGVTVALLKRNGIEVFSDRDLNYKKSKGDKHDKF